MSKAIDKITKDEFGNIVSKYRVQGNDVYQYSRDAGAYRHVWRNHRFEGANLVEDYERNGTPSSPLF